MSKKINSKNKRLWKALNYAIEIIESYDLDCKNLSNYLKEHDPVGFCQGSIYRKAVKDIKKIAGKHKHEWIDRVIIGSCRIQQVTKECEICGKRVIENRKLTKNKQRSLEDFNMNIKQKWETPEGQKLLKKLEKQFGKYKKITLKTNGKSYKVPTKDILTIGIKGKDLSKYPEWKK